MHDPDGGHHGRGSWWRADLGQADAGIPTDEGSGHGHFLGLRNRHANRPYQWAYEPDWEFHQEEADRIQEFRSCIECMLCVNTCHVLREHKKFDEFAGPRFFVRLAGLEMHPLDTENRIPRIKDDFGIGYCNITKCCTEVCPAGIKITDNAIIPLKERVVTEFYDPLAIVARRLGIKEKLPKPSPRLYVGDANVKVARRALEKERGRAENARKLERKRVERARGKG